MKILCPLTYGDALALADPICPVAASRICPPHDGNKCSICQAAAKALMAVDCASREQAWADRGGPELLATLKAIEWIGDEEAEFAGVAFCPACGNEKSEGHDRRCEVAKVLAKAQGR
jgi:hypothetical protein